MPPDGHSAHVEGNQKAFESSAAPVAANGLMLKVFDNKAKSNLIEFFTTGPGHKTRQALMSIMENMGKCRPVGQFLSFSSLFLPKLVVGGKVCFEEVQRQIYAEQGLTQYPPELASSWLDTRLQHYEGELHIQVSAHPPGN